MEHNILSLDFRRDTVTYEGKTVPTGTLGCYALNILDTVIAKQDELFVCMPVSRYSDKWNARSALLPTSKEAAEKFLKLLRAAQPFNCWDMDFYIPNICKAFMPEGIQYCFYDRHSDSGANRGTQIRCSARTYYACSGTACFFSVGCY